MIPRKSTLVGLLIVFFIHTSSALERPTQQLTWTNEAEACIIADEGNTCPCPAGQLVVGLECRKKYCDDVHMRCASIPDLAFDMSNVPQNKGDPRRNSNTFTRWFTDDDRNRGMQCPRDHAIVSMECKGRYCDDMAAYCAPVVQDNPVELHIPDTDAEGCYWTGGFGSGDGLRSCKETHVPTGFKCFGRYCGAFNMRCCPVKRRLDWPTPSQQLIQTAMDTMTQSCWTEFLNSNKIDPEHFEAVEHVETLIGDASAISHNNALFMTVDKVRGSDGLFSTVYNEFAQSAVIPTKIPNGDKIIESAQTKVEHLERARDLRRTELSKLYAKRTSHRKQSEANFEKYLARDPKYAQAFRAWRTADLKLKKLLNQVYGAQYVQLQTSRRNLEFTLSAREYSKPNLNMRVSKTSSNNNNSSANSTFAYVPLWKAENAKKFVEEWRKNGGRDFTCTRTMDGSMKVRPDDGKDSGKADIFTLPVGVKGTDRAIKNAFAGAKLRVEYSWQGLRVIDVEPGKWFLPDWGYVRALDARGQKRLTAEQRKANSLIDQYFGSTGKLRSRVKQIVIGYKPTYKFTMDQLHSDTIKRTLESGKGACVLGLCGSNQASGKFKENSIQVLQQGFQLTDSSDSPILLGVVWDTYKQQMK